MLAITFAEAAPILLGVGGLTSVATFVVQALNGRGERDQAARALIAQQWTDLLEASARAHTECLAREAELRARVEKLEGRLYRVEAGEP